jgi:hypothetical protein
MYWHSRVPAGYDVAIAGGRYPVGGKDVVRVVAAPIVRSTVEMNQLQDLGRELVTGDGGEVTTRVRFVKADTFAVDIALADGGTVHRNVRVEPVRRLGWAALLFVIVAVLIPYALPRGSLAGAGTTTPWGPWYALLSEAGGGYSLARVQLLIWFFPTAVLYAAFSFTLQDFAEINAQIAVLVGLSGATTLLGTAASPTTTTASTGAVSPDMSDLVTDWNSQGDLSRYQYLLLSMVGATVMVAAFWRQLELPTIPAQFLYLVAGSQGTYVATKAVKTAKMGDADTTPAKKADISTLPVPAPATVTLAPPATGTSIGSFQPARK